MQYRNDLGRKHTNIRNRNVDIGKWCWNNYNSFFAYIFSNRIRNWIKRIYVDNRQSSMYCLYKHCYHYKYRWPIRSRDITSRCIVFWWSFRNRISKRK